MSRRLRPGRRARGMSIPALIALAAMAWPTAAWAHAEFVTASPEAGATVEWTPAEVAGTYTERLTAASSIEIRDSNGTTLATGGRDPSDRKRLVLVPPPLPAGEYEVRWTAISTVDGHPERGTWRFMVIDPPSPSPSAIPTPTSAASASSVPPTAEPTVASTQAATPTPAPTPDPSNAGSDDADAIVPIVAALVLLGLLGGALLGRRGKGGSAA